MKISRRTFLLGSLALTGLGATSVAQAYRFEVNRHSLPLPGLRRPLRIAQLSDLHYGPYVRAASVGAWVDAALGVRPDLIVITGDFLDHNLAEEPAPLLGELARLHAPLGVWAVWGNHDYGSFGAYRSRLGFRTPGDWRAHREAFGLALARAGVQVLRNKGVQLREDVHLAGVDDLMWGEVRLDEALRQAPRSGEAVLLLSHNPDLLPEVPAWVGLTLSGHTHGGQVRLPLVGAPVVPSRYGQRFAQGFVSAPAPGFVSRGLGVSGVPARLSCPPEVVVLDLQPGGEVAP